MAKPPLVLVVGMHRSGTSLLGGFLQYLGLSLPGETIVGDRHNPEGYFEWQKVVDIQERLLIDLERWWPAAEGTLALPENWQQHPATREARAALRNLLVAEVDRQHGPWGIKDPRCSRLLPLWIDLAAELDLPLNLLLAVRDPAEVVRSLLSRDGPLTGLDVNRGQQLWWRHNLEVVHVAKASMLPIAVVDFGCWFTLPEVQLQRLLQAIPALQPSQSKQQEALALIRPEHRRSLKAADTVPLMPCVRRLHQRLQRIPLPRSWPSAEPPVVLGRSQIAESSCERLLAVPSAWSEQLVSWQHYPAPRWTQPLRLAAHPVLSSCGPSWCELRPHLLLQRLPIDDLANWQLDPEVSTLHQLRLKPATDLVDDSAADEEVAEAAIERITLNLELPPPERAEQWLAHLHAQQLIWDPDPARVRLLRALDLPAWWLDLKAAPNGWLQQHAAVHFECWAGLLGLAPPSDDALLVLCPAGSDFERDLTAEAAQGALGSGLPIDYLPGWPELIVDTPAAGLARAGWLQSAAASARRLVVISESSIPSELQLLADPLAEPFAIAAPTSLAELRGLHAGMPLLALAEERQSPPVEELFHWRSSELPQEPLRAAVLVSLFNYADRIKVALDSVQEQRLSSLELIVVDDASADGSVERVRMWMEACVRNGAHPFNRLSLLRHGCNTGLAAARNSAFTAAESDWCFVLDADNALFPEAISACLALVDAGDQSLAVVHPLLAVEAELGRPDDQRSLVGTAAWQRERLCVENTVDAMALVRRSAWQAVAGYTHIEGGWEDYDFWCKLIDAGFYGLQCPQVLGVYRSHSESMSHTATNSSWRALSRTLQARHPWLQLPLAQP